MCISNFIYPRRMKKYISGMAYIYEKAVYWELDWKQAIIDFMDSEYNPYTDDEKNRIKDFLDYLKYCGQTPLDWDIHWNEDDYNTEIQAAVKSYHIRKKIEKFFDEKC